MPCTVLLVDDSQTIRNIIKVHLMGLDFNFIEADGGFEALKLLQTSTVVLIIADINMPGMDGLSFVRRVRLDERPLVRQIPIILLTSNKLDSDRAGGLAAGANAFLKKPVASSNLLMAVRQFVRPTTASK